MMIVTTLIAATVAAQAPPAPQPVAAPAPAAQKKMACCEKMAKGEGCTCCMDMAKEDHGQASKDDGGAADHNH